MFLVSSDLHEQKDINIIACKYINIISESIYQYMELIGNKEWWINNGIQIWESITQKLGGRVKSIYFEN
jgi:hypothetical protein